VFLPKPTYFANFNMFYSYKSTAVIFGMQCPWTATSEQNKASNKTK